MTDLVIVPVRCHGRVKRFSSGGFYWWDGRCLGCHRHITSNTQQLAFQWTFLHVRESR